MSGILLCVMDNPVRLGALRHPVSALLHAGVTLHATLAAVRSLGLDLG